MDFSNGVVRRKSLKERLGLRGFGCCGSTWGARSPPVVILTDDEDEEGPQQQQHIDTADYVQPPPENIISDHRGCVGMNLATALAAERQYRATQDPDVGPAEGTAGTAPGTPLRVSLMRLLEEANVAEEEEEGGEMGVRCDRVCCVCMGRKKGAAFIPCGHTFCRVCSRELWFNRGSCPLCNRPILEILDIF